MVSQQLLAAYRAKRQWQRDTYGNSGLHLPDGSGSFRDARQFVGGGAAYQNHARAAYWAARRSIAFRKDLAATIANANKRSKAARAGWKTRRAGVFS